MIPIEIQLHICSFLHQKELKELIIISTLKKKTFLKKSLILIYKKNLKYISNLLFLTFESFERTKFINTFDEYINYKSKIYLNFNDEIIKNKILAYNLFLKLKNTIKNKKDRNKYINICKHMLITEEYTFPKKINTLNYY